jgi:hypothetical protein
MKIKEKDYKNKSSFFCNRIITLSSINIKDRAS